MKKKTYENYNGMEYYFKTCNILLFSAGQCLYEFLQKLKFHLKINFSIIHFDEIFMQQFNFFLLHKEDKFVKMAF